MASVCLALIFLISAVDLGIKWWVEKNVTFRKDQEILGGHFILRKVHNRGMMMNLAEKRTELVKAGSVAATVTVLAIQFLLAEKPGYVGEKAGLSLICGGAISNTVDRIKRGYVVDYLAFNSDNKKRRRITYNIGDFAVFAGGILLVIASIMNSKE